MRRRPHQAIILAAGLATRLRPLTAGQPKATLPIWNRPALHHVLDLLVRWGVRDALINLHHQPDAVFQAARRWTGPIRLAFSFEPLQPLGTGGALRAAAWCLDAHPFWLVNADVMADADPAPLLAALAGPGRPLAALWMVPDAGPRTVAIQDGFVADFAVPNPGTPGTATFSGVHLVRPELLRYLPDTPVSSIITAYRRAMADGRRIAGVTLPGAYWDDIGTFPEYRRAHAAILAAWRTGAPGGRLCDPGADRVHRALRRRGVRVAGFAAVAPDAVIGRGARLQNCVIGAGAAVAPGAAIRDAVLAPGVRVRGAVEGLAVPAGLIAGAAPFLAAHGWPAAETAALPLSPRGSDRAFFRLQRGRARAILVQYGKERTENALYAGHTRFLAGLGLRVPALLAHDPRARLLLLEDAGSRDLLAAAGGAPERRQIALYTPVLALAVRLHTADAAAARQAGLRLMPGFSPALYRWERNYFTRHFLRGRMGLAPRAAAALAGELESVAHALGQEPRRLIHRDFQSTNILLPQTGTPVLIDYQGMRLGAAAYDLASLLADPYVSLSESVQAALLEEYRRRSGMALPDPLFWAAVLQRLAQALGAYAVLGARPPTAGFARHIPPALAMMRRAVARLGPDRTPRLARFLDRASAASPDPR